MVNGAEKLLNGVSSPEVPANSNVPKKSRRQRQRKKAAKTQTAPSNPTEAGPSSPKDPIEPVSITDNDKPKNWEASLTIAEIKALKSEEATKKHNQRFPPRAKRDADHITKPKKARQVPPAAPKAEAVQKPQPAPSQKPKSAAAKKVKPTPANEVKTVQTTPSSDGDQSGILYSRPLPPCGIRGCPVKADHERRPYVFNEKNRPAMIKMIQNKAHHATEADWRTLDRFFILHELVGKPAKVNA